MTDPRVSASAQEAADLNSESSLPLADLFASELTWRGKHSLSALWTRRLKKVSWLALRSGRIYERLTRPLSVETSTSSAGDTPVNHSPMQASGLARLMSDTYGPKLLASLARQNRHCVCSRTSGDTFAWDSGESSVTWRTWITELRAASLWRRKLARRMAGSDSLSSQWPTACTMDGEIEETVPKWEARAARKRMEGINLQRKLGVEAQRMMAANWATPKVQTGKYCYSQGDHDKPVLNLEGEAANWRTPEGTDGEGGVMEIRPDANGHYKLRDQAANWPTASARDHKGSLPLDARDRTMGTLDEAAEQIFPSSPLDQPTSTDGGKSSQSTRRLNPRFVGWLMGWPRGWTDFECSATEFHLYKQRMRSCLYGLLLNMTGSEE